MGWFKIVAFIGAAALVLAIAPSAELSIMDISARTLGALSLLWGAFYYLIKEEDYLYGVSGLILSIIFQPFFLLPIEGGMWMIVDAIGILYLILAGLMCIKIEKRHALERARIEAELAGYHESSNSHDDHRNQKH